VIEPLHASGNSPTTPPAADASATGPVDASHHDDAADATAACEPVGESCGNAGQCCSAYCHGGTCTCRSIGFACAHDADCCAGLGCTNGVCGNNDPNAYAVCQTCGSAAPCADGAPFCIRADGYADETYCASDCTANPNVCAPDMTCTALLDDQLQPTGTSDAFRTTRRAAAPMASPSAISRARARARRAVAPATHVSGPKRACSACCAPTRAPASPAVPDRLACCGHEPQFAANRDWPDPREINRPTTIADDCYVADANRRTTRHRREARPVRRPFGTLGGPPTHRRVWVRATPTRSSRASFARVPGRCIKARSCGARLVLRPALSDPTPACEARRTRGAAAKDYRA
jgi:hypothetical protein